MMQCSSCLENTPCFYRDKDDQPLCRDCYMVGLSSSVLVPVLTPIKDSGKREEFSTGAVRDIRDDKGRYDLLSPVFLRELALHVEAGAKKYCARNWEKGITLGRTLDSCLRHLNQWREGDRSENHLVAAACNIMFLIHHREGIKKGLLPPSLDDNHYITEEEYKK